MYLTLEQYRQMGGRATSFTDDDFPNAEFDARVLLDRYTHRRIIAYEPQEITENIRRCMVKLIDMMRTMPVPGALNGRAVLSESNDGVSHSYAEQTPGDVEQAILDVIGRYLSGERTKSGIPLLFAGRRVT